ncbi:MAG TPA: SNF2-related protein [Acidimicrobiales bacterium]|nr:SNF2-related protein [Acidimicrobiales bacterium]
MPLSSLDTKDGLEETEGGVALGALAGREVTFEPADPPRAGRFVIFDPASGPVAEGVEVAAPAGKTIRRRRVAATHLSVGELLPLLMELDSHHPMTPPRPSALVWASVMTAGLGVVARGRLFPTVTAAGYDGWRAGPLGPVELDRLEELAAAFPAWAHALPIEGSAPVRLHTPSWLIRAAWDALADALVRTPAASQVTLSPLFSVLEPQPVGDLRHWLARAEPGIDTGPAVALRVEFLDEPGWGDLGGEGRVARGVIQVTSRDDPNLVVDQADLAGLSPDRRAALGADAAEGLRMALHRGARAWPPLLPLTEDAGSEGLGLDDARVEDLAGDGGAALGGAGIEVLWPSDLSATGLTLEAAISSAATGTGTPVSGALTLDTVLEFRWRVAMDGVILSEEELARLAGARGGIVRLRGRWMMADLSLVDKATSGRVGRMGSGEAIGSLLGGHAEIDGQRVPVVAHGAITELVERLAKLGEDESIGSLEPPPGLVGELRPYQLRGVAWLEQMCHLGLGGCLADDMGLGKTIQVIGLHLHRRARGEGTMLVVCPTSLLGNWERELQRFAPGVPVRRYHGGDRHLDDLADDEVVLATYGVVRRDHQVLAAAGFSLVVADEAQHAKNPHSETARSLRAIPSAARVALTGTPVENRLTELWSILDWTTPGLLGPLRRFRRSVAVPVERYHDTEVTERLTRVIRPFLLRRRKSDPAISPELPPRTVSDLPVPLTPEQASLYAGEVTEALAVIAERTGISRRGLVLRLLTVLKQICNHPAQYLHEPAPVMDRSGKLSALEELLEVILAEGESVLVFSQFVEMLTLIESRLKELGVGSLFLHGGVPSLRREEMVEAFQAGAAPVFLLSLKAGGVGLNLTRATHVIHFDRWWNPAVEDQATDRAHRIGQDRPVQVHRLVTEGTLEDRIAVMLERKRNLAEVVVGEGEAWLTELSNDQLAELVTLSSPGDDR